jgi:NTP pyrophosphatase (non-canonical NTP hydrolase)
MKEFDEFVSIMRRLRRECPWDKEQTHESLKKHFVEEAYEALDAIDRKNFSDLKGELGDVALQVLFHSIIAEEEKRFTVEDVFTSINEKLIRRHPHIYGDAVVTSGAEQSALWDKIKMSEGRTSVLDGIPNHYPALMKAEKYRKKHRKWDSTGRRRKMCGKKWRKRSASYIPQWSRGTRSTHRRNSAMFSSPSSIIPGSSASIRKNRFTILFGHLRIVLRTSKNVFRNREKIFTPLLRRKWMHCGMKPSPFFDSTELLQPVGDHCRIR